MMKLSHKFLLLIGVVVIAMSCVTVPDVVSPTLAPTFDSSTLAPNIFVQDSSDWALSQIQSPALEPRPQNKPQLVIGLDGRIHVFWDTLASEESFIYHSYYQDGVWSTPAPISLSLGTSKLYVTPIVSQDGTIHVIWKNDLKLGGPYRLLYAQFDGKNWSEESEVYISEKNPNLWGTLFVDDASMLHAVVKAPAGIDSDLFYLTKNGNNWIASEAITPKIGLDGLVIWRYKAMPSGKVLLYGKDLKSNLRFSSWENNTVGEVTKTNIPLPIYDTYFVDRDGNYITYWTGQVPVPGGTTTGVYYQCIDTNLHPWSETVLSAEKTAITKPLVAQNQENTVMSWLTKDNLVEFLFPNGCDAANIYDLNLPETGVQRQLSSLAISNTSNKLCMLTNSLNFNTLELYCMELKN